MKDFWKLTGEKLRLTGYIILIFIFIDAVTSQCIHTSNFIVNYLTCEVNHLLFEPTFGEKFQGGKYDSYISIYLISAFLISHTYYYLLKKIRHGQKPHRIKKQ